MTNEICSLEPKSLWTNFYNLTQIPRPSKHEEKVVEWLYNFGLKLGLETEKDDVGNVIIRKPATAGFENRKTVVLQAHVDMVPQKNSQTEFDFLTQPIETYIDGDWVTAKDTTLGSDNGIGAAAALAILEDKTIDHGPIEALFTIDEETGMHGAFGLKPGFVKADIMLNLDSEDEGELYVGCAGGLNVTGKFVYTEEEVPEGDVAFRLALTGLKGGHSGIDINKGRANANKLLFRFLKTAIPEVEARLASVNGGSLRNAIPREAFAVVTIPEGAQDDLMELIEEFESTFKSEYYQTENAISFDAIPCDLPSGLIPEMIQDDLVHAINAVHNGVYRMDQVMEGVVEASNNIAIVKSDGSKIEINCLTRGAMDSIKYQLASELESTFSLAGAACISAGDYPGWVPNTSSEILKVMSESYEKRTGKSPEIKAIHAGLECGIIGATYPDLDMISFGPTIRYPHSPDEKVHIESVNKFWLWLIETLELIPTK